MILGNYPMGSDTPDAPWNQKEPNAEEYKVIISQTLSKSVTISSIEDEKNIEWVSTYLEQHYTPQQLISICGKIAKELYDIYKDQANTPQNRKEMSKLKEVMDECTSWSIDELEVIKEK